MGFWGFGVLGFWVQFGVNLSCVNLGMPIWGCVNLDVCKSELCKFEFV